MFSGLLTTLLSKNKAIGSPVSFRIPGLRQWNWDLPHPQALSFCENLREPGPDLFLAPLPSVLHRTMATSNPEHPPTWNLGQGHGPRMGYRGQGPGFRNIEVQSGLGQVCCVVSPHKCCFCYLGEKGRGIGKKAPQGSRADPPCSRLTQTQLGHSLVV